MTDQQNQPQRPPERTCHTCDSESEPGPRCPRGTLGLGVTVHNCPNWEPRQQPAEPKQWILEREAIADHVQQKRRHQLIKWGQQDHEYLYWLGILQEEVGELAKRVIENDAPEFIEEEALQVAAVASAIAQQAHFGGPV